MSRFKDLCSSSDSDEEVQRRPVQRGRVRENQRFQEVKPKEIEQAETAQIIIPKKKKPTKQKPKSIPEQISLNIQTNQNKESSSLDSNQKFIRQQVKPVQQHLQHFLGKMQDIQTQRKKFTTALKTCSKDLQKVSLKISELKSDELKLKYSSPDHTQRESVSSISIKLKNMLQLQQKITLHLTKLMKEHENTIQLITQIRKDMDRTFQKVRFSFLDLRGIDLYNQEKDQYETFGILQIYKCLKEADRIVEQITSFSK